MLGVALPFGLGARAGVSANPASPAPMLRFRPFEEAVLEAFSDHGRTSSNDEAGRGGTHPCRRVEVGESDLVRAGVQGCYNDRPFAGFPSGCLRIVRTGSGPGPVHLGARLYVSTVDIVLTDGPPPGVPYRPLDFASLPPAPILS